MDYFTYFLACIGAYYIIDKIHKNFPKLWEIVTTIVFFTFYIFILIKLFGNGFSVYWLLWFIWATVSMIYTTTHIKSDKPCSTFLYIDKSIAI